MKFGISSDKGRGIRNTCGRSMVLLKYFQKVSVLPNPDGSLSYHVPLAAIASANEAVGDLVARESDVPDATSSRKKRGQYLSYTEKEKARIAKRASEFGVTNALKYFSCVFCSIFSHALHYSCHV